MKKENPLLDAVRARSKPQKSRSANLDLQDVPRGTRPGDEISLTIKGTVESIQKDGSVSIAVTEVSQEAKREEAQTPQVLNVRTQESHA